MRTLLANTSLCLRNNITDHLRVAPLLIFLTVGLHVNIRAQALLDSRHSSYYTYLYKLTDKEAKKIYKKDLWVVDTSFFHTLVDSVATDSLQYLALPRGHYLRAFTDKDQLRLSITSVPGFDVRIVNNNTDLNIRIYDLEGFEVEDAKVTLRSKRLRYDKKSHSYRDKKSNRRGLLKVSRDGFTAFYSINREYNNPQYKRTSNKILYSVPLKYVWIPVRFVVFIPIDGVRSVVYGNTSGSIYHIERFFRNSYRKIACLFDPYHCNYYNKFSEKHKGYLVFNKPKYIPGDTVKFKAFIINKKGKPIKGKVDVMLGKYGNNVKLTELSPYRKGAYSYAFPLHDSLQLLLDSRLELILQKSEEKVYLSEYFSYEDYELASINLEIRTSDKDHYSGKPFSLFVTGTDENKLQLLDANIEVVAMAKKPSQYFDTAVFVPDTLYHTQRKLEAKGQTELIIPDSLFPSVNMNYQVTIKLATSDNETLSKSKQVVYYYNQTEVDHNIEGDSISVIYKVNDEPKATEARIFGVDHFGNRTETQVRKLPAKLKVNPYFADYLVQLDSLEEWLDLESESSLIQCLSSRNADSIHLSVSNPRGIPFNYFIYRKNTELTRGYGKVLEFSRNSPGNENYFVLIQYLWAGKIHDENYKIPFDRKALNITVQQPSVIYPGQTAEIEVTVLDQNGRPVPNVDLTAYAYTNKFDASNPNLPERPEKKRNKEVINNFRLDESKLENHSEYLDYNTWKVLANLDSIPYYQFRYPESGIYQTTFPANDGTTQFAPFVFSGMWRETVHVVYVDRQPVYFEWSQNPRPYSFRIDSGYHQIILRTRTKEIKLDSIYFAPRKKTILSVDSRSKNPQIEIQDATYKLSTAEKRRLYPYIFPYRSHTNHHFTYLLQGKHAMLLSDRPGYGRSMLAGPVLPTWLTFKKIDGFSSSFEHEPFFEYDFSPRILKMRSVDRNLRYPSILSGSNTQKNLNDIVLTESRILEIWDERLATERRQNARYRNPSTTGINRGSLLVDFKYKDDQSSHPLNTLMVKHDDHDFIRVYQGATKVFHNLRQGLYKLIVFYPGSSYQVYDSIMVHKNGLNYRLLDGHVAKQKDSFSKKINEMIESQVFKGVEYDYKNKNLELENIRREYHQKFVYEGAGHIISGYVYSADDNEPVPGVNVIAKGTSIGTVTDIDGYYQMKVPSNITTVVYSFIGMVTEEVHVHSAKHARVYLTSDVCQLSEVVVTGYGGRTRSNLTSAITTINGSTIPAGINFANQLQGKVAGISIDKDGGTTIAVRGASSMQFNKQPMYIIDGVIYNGDISELVPDDIDYIQISKDASAAAIYGSRAANGVVVISTKANTFQPTGFHLPNAEETLAGYGQDTNSIRSNFSDYGYWQPRLTSDEKGKAKFEVTFPDDVTSWKTIVLAINSRKQSGMKTEMIKSFKPLMAKLALPRFLVVGDTANAIGKILNYTTDTVSLTTTFAIEDSTYFSNERYCGTATIDTLTFTGQSSDSITLKYFLERENGYLDGEQKKVPIYPVGMQETVGQFHALDQDTTVHLTFDETLGSVTIYAIANMLEVLEKEIDHVGIYRYDCNEQMASKLKVLLAQKAIDEYQERSAKSGKKINALINKLSKSSTPKGLWGWWEQSTHSWWISLHVLEALTQAREMGYKTGFDKSTVTDYLLWKLSDANSVGDKLRMLKVLKTLGANVNYPAFINDLDTAKLSSLHQLLQLIELKQLCKLNVATDTVQHYANYTMMGNLYFDQHERESSLLNNAIENTLLAYKIIRADSSGREADLWKMIGFLLEQKRQGHWANTYQSARIIETILPDILRGRKKVVGPQMQISGAFEDRVRQFPFEACIEPKQPISVSNTGDVPIYVTAYQSFQNPKPLIHDSHFVVTSHFDGFSGNNMLEAGEQVKLVVDVVVKKDAEFVMIEVPVPASCSYASKEINHRLEEHREYFREQTSIFCKSLKAGSYQFEIALVPRFSGRYHLNPAKASLMYFPTFFGNNLVKKVAVESINQ
jgi:TonB-dependent SusC/RagA subfamily outer membrane receptor